jgi:hypothetical protein
MQPLSRFDASTPTQLHALISDLKWRVQLLDADIAEEERKAGNSDTASPAYPMLAITLRGRRDNLLATVATLAGRLEAIAPAEWPHAA